MKKQSIRFLALFLAVLMVLSGCTAAPADGTTQPADATAETAAESGSKEPKKRGRKPKAEN